MFSRFRDFFPPGQKMFRAAEESWASASRREKAGLTGLPEHVARNGSAPRQALAAGNFIERGALDEGLLFHGLIQAVRGDGEQPLHPCWVLRSHALRLTIVHADALARRDDLACPFVVNSLEMKAWS